MCGLTLVINKYRNGFNKQQQDVFNTLMYLSGGFRGRDGAGVALIDNIGNVKIAKDGTSVDPFLQTKEFADLEKDAFHTGWAMIGHNRAATRGVVSDKNSHPFVVDDKIVLVHNGTHYGDHKKLKDTEVDSEAIAHVLSENKNVTAALRSINAAYALIWYNVDDKALHIIRNSQRPLYYIETDSSYFYSSEGIFLQFVIDKYFLKCKRPEQLVDNYLNSFTLQKDKGTIETGESIDVDYHKHNRSTYQPDVAQSEYPFGDWGFCGDYGGVQTRNYPRLPEIPASTETADQTRKIMMALKEDNQTPVQPRLYSDYSVLGEEYKVGEKFRVLVNDLVEADDNPKTKNFILIGRTMDRNKLPVAFHISDQSLESVCELTARAVFEVEFNSLRWSRVEELFPVDITMDLKDWPGVCLLHGKNAKPIYISEAANDNA